MLNIYVARHGQDEDNMNGIINGRRDTPLTELGILQAQKLLEKIKQAGLNFDAIYNSPLRRALQTARIISAGLEMGEPSASDLLTERDYGDMTGKPVSKIPSLCEDILVTEKIIYFLSPPNGETYDQTLVRAGALLDILAEKHKKGKILLVTHSCTGKMIFAAYHGLPWLDVLKAFHFGNAELLLLSPKTKPDAAHIFKFNQENV